GILLFFIFYGPILSKAFLADKLQEENDRLLKYQYKVQLLEQNLNQTREIVTRLINLAGVDIEFPALPDDSTLFASLDEAGMAAVKRAAGPDLSVPSGLPVTGFITRAFILEDSTHYHPGIDIACSEGTPVLATATGEVVMTGFDGVYGNIVVIKHNDSMTTLYGHNKEILVETGEKVMPGSRVALSGNTGKSTAPHVHYEIRINDEPINPMEKQ
ncbi:MAG TPA: M23 family metallopeptidase, partial [candidate division Zixibacteria bacterium]|nr:M23 family metallopeptidase [candidate division Zixibacteria bacterium]